MNYGEFGGQYVPQELKEKLNEIEKEFNKAKENNNTELVQKLIKDCMNYKATKIKNNLNQKNVIILVQSVEQANIISNNKNNIL